MAWRDRLCAIGTGRGCAFNFLTVGHGLSSGRLLEALNCCVLYFLWYGFKKKNPVSFTARFISAVNRCDEGDP